MNNHRPRTLRREFRRWLLIPRARRVRFEREMLELAEFLDAIREDGMRLRPSFTEQVLHITTYADEVE